LPLPRPDPSPSPVPDRRSGAPSRIAAVATLSIGIVVYRPDLALLASTLGSLRVAVDVARKDGAADGVAVTLINNGPSEGDELQRLLAASLPPDSGLEVTVVAGQGNVGYGSGHNLAIASSLSEYHLVLNPDVVLEPDALLEALRFLRQHPDVALLAPEVRGRDGRLQYLCRRYPSVLVLLLRGFAPPLVRRRFAGRLARYELRDRLEEPVVRPVPLASGCFMLARRELLAAVGGFSPDYFLYFEDYDLSMRLRPMGEIAYVRKVRITHFGGDTARKGGRHVCMFVRSGLRFFQTHGWKLL
jgi:GT2 family glycosyltransferase